MGRSATRATNALLALNMLAFVLPWATGQLETVLVNGGFIPARFGVADDGLLVPAWATPLTSSFLHFDWMHLGFNMLMLWVLGQQLEVGLGGGRLVALYVVGALAGAAAHALLGEADGIMVGASGAVSAFLAAGALLTGGASRTPSIAGLAPRQVRVLWLAAAWIGLQLLIGVASDGGIAIWSHIGGFLAGLAVTRPLLRSRFGG